MESQQLQDKLNRLVADAEKTWADGVTPVQETYIGPNCACLVGASVMLEHRKATPFKSSIGTLCIEKYEISDVALSGLIQGFDGQRRINAEDCMSDYSDYLLAYDVAREVAKKHIKGA